MFQLYVTETFAHYGLNNIRNALMTEKLSQVGFGPGPGAVLSSLPYSVFCVVFNLESLKTVSDINSNHIHIRYYLYPKREEELIPLNYQSLSFTRCHISVSC